MPLNPSLTALKGELEKRMPEFLYALNPNNVLTEGRGMDVRGLYVDAQWMNRTMKRCIHTTLAAAAFKNDTVFGQQLFQDTLIYTQTSLPRLTFGEEQKIRSDSKAAANETLKILEPKGFFAALPQVYATLEALTQMTRATFGRPPQEPFFAIELNGLKLAMERLDCSNTPYSVWALDLNERPAAEKISLQEVIELERTDLDQLITLLGQAGISKDQVQKDRMERQRYEALIHHLPTAYYAALGLLGDIPPQELNKKASELNLYVPT